MHLLHASHIVALLKRMRNWESRMDLRENVWLKRIAKFIEVLRSELKNMK